MRSAIYAGSLRHRRFLPRSHEFSYGLTLFYIDLDEIPHLFTGVRGWSIDRFNFGSFRRSDFLAPHNLSLKEAVQQRVKSELGYCPAGAVRMLTNLRIWGFCFNPVTFYYIYEVNADSPSWILAEVNNTPWNQRHSYLVPCDTGGKTQQEFAKEFHVSPFNPMAMDYHWVSTSPAEKLLVHMENRDRKTAICHMDATLSLIRRDWTKQNLQRLLWQAPWAAVKVPLAIYWQALRLLIKRVPYFSHPGSTTSQSPTNPEISKSSPKVKL